MKTGHESTLKNARTIKAVGMFSWRGPLMTGRVEEEGKNKVENVEKSVVS